MFFFNGRIRNAHIVPMVTSDRPLTNKAGHSGIVAGCLLVITGLVLIVIGLISETEKTALFAIGIISLGFGFLLSTFVCFYTKLKICYRNWAYGPHITRSQIENSQLATAGDTSISYLTGATATTHKVPTMIPLPHQKPVNMLSNVRINNVIISPTREIGKTVTNTGKVT